jgi:8-oxo-dGTP pyrophosphatase MutT (NUDIX family)
MVDLNNITAAQLRESFAGTRMPEDPTAVVMPPGSESWPAGMREQLAQTLKPAGVLIPIIERDVGLSVLLTQRSAELKHHAAQVSFPGGRMEESDTDILAAALRETHEEVGIAPQEVSVIGFLDPMPTVTGYAVTPVVGLLSEPADLMVDTSEVEYAFEVPLLFLLDKRNQRAAEREFHGKKMPIIEFVYDDKRIWGATAFMLVNLRNLLLKQ